MKKKIAGRLIETVVIAAAVLLTVSAVHIRKSDVPKMTGTEVIYVHSGQTLWDIADDIAEDSTTIKGKIVQFAHLGNAAYFVSLVSKNVYKLTAKTAETKEKPLRQILTAFNLCCPALSALFISEVYLADEELAEIIYSFRI